MPDNLSPHLSKRLAALEAERDAIKRRNDEWRSRVLATKAAHEAALSRVERLEKMLKTLRRRIYISGKSPEAHAHTAYWRALDLGYSTFAAMAMAEAVREMHAARMENRHD